MEKKVLIVDDDKDLLIILEKGLERYRDVFSLLMAEDGEEAVKKLKENNVSMVVTDLKMPRMDGFALLAHINECYPDIPVVIITAYATPKMEDFVQEGGAAGYIEKPFMIGDLAQQIMTILKKESEGGSLRGVSSGMFMQLIETEQKTCTLRLSERNTGKQGVLFFIKGELLDARCGEKQGEQAALEILSWEDASISIQNSCALKEKKIHRDMQAILMEAMRLKDESGEKDDKDQKSEEIRSPSKSQAEANTSKQSYQVKEVSAEKKESFSQELKNKLNEKLGGNATIKEVMPDEEWNSFIRNLNSLGTCFEIGSFQVGFIQHRESDRTFLIPAKKTLVVRAESKCPRDKLMNILCSLQERIAKHN